MLRCLLKLCFVILPAGFSSVAIAQALPQRPPQYVLISFDGSYNLNVWEKIRSFSTRQKNQGIDSRFTFFASGVYFISTDNKTLYQAPQQKVGRSNIGFGDSSEDVALRVDQVNHAFAEGHEIGSHANGHFDGSSWSFQEWMSEFDQFEKFIFEVFSLNQISPRRAQVVGWHMNRNDIKGFRAPLLETSQGLWQTLRDKRYSYDCSKVESSTYWPQKSGIGLWNFPLAELRIAGTGKRTLSMDYNFYVSQSGGSPDTANREVYSQQMYETYLSWFQQNYNGNRAPLNIGHHFSSWNDGAYFDALTQFVEKVCGLDEVKCVTYSEYVKWLESLSPEVLSSYRKGLFERPVPLRIAQQVESPINASVIVALKKDDQGNPLLVAQASAERLTDLRVALSVNGNRLHQSSINLAAFEQGRTTPKNLEVTAHLYNQKGTEVARSTQTLTGLRGKIGELSEQAFEKRALLGDLSEAHFDERL